MIVLSIPVSDTKATVVGSYLDSTQITNITGEMPTLVPQPSRTAILCINPVTKELFYEYPFSGGPIGNPVTLQDYQANKSSEMAFMYNQTLESGFTSSCTGSPLTYDYSTESQTKWSKLFIGMSIQGAIPDTMFPMGITLKNGTVVPHTKAQLIQLCGDLTLWESQLETKYQSYTNSTGSIMSATTIDQVNAITW